jgi:hypothetical protein
VLARTLHSSMPQIRTLLFSILQDQISIQTRPFRFRSFSFVNFSIVSLASFHGTTSGQGSAAFLPIQSFPIKRDWKTTCETFLLLNETMGSSNVNYVRDVKQMVVTILYVDLSKSQTSNSNSSLLSGNHHFPVFSTAYWHERVSLQEQKCQVRTRVVWPAPRKHGSWTCREIAPAPLV